MAVESVNWIKSSTLKRCCQMIRAAGVGFSTVHFSYNRGFCYLQDVLLQSSLAVAVFTDLLCHYFFSNAK